jgi:hypothetical protein
VSATARRPNQRNPIRDRDTRASSPISSPPRSNSVSSPRKAPAATSRVCKGFGSNFFSLDALGQMRWSLYWTQDIQPRFREPQNQDRAGLGSADPLSSSRLSYATLRGDDLLGGPEPDRADCGRDLGLAARRKSGQRSPPVITEMNVTSGGITRSSLGAPGSCKRRGTCGHVAG